VSDPLGVEELQGGCDITNNLDGFLLSEEFPFSNFIQELSTQHLLKDEVKPLSLLEIFDEVDDVLVTLQWTEG